MQRKRKRRFGVVLRKRWRRMRRRIDYRRFLPFLAFLIIGVTGLSMLIGYAVESAARRRENERLAQIRLQETPQPEVRTEISEEIIPVSAEAVPVGEKRSYHSLDGEISDRMLEIYRQNSDLIGWLQIDGVVDLPVVYRDNEYYLTHSFTGREDSGGTLFLDQAHPMAEETQNLVIHGHNMRDSSMFGILSNYNKLAVLKNHAFAEFSTLYSVEEYVVFAVLRVNTDPESDEYFNYTGTPQFVDDADFYRYTDEVKNRSMFDIPVDVQPTDAILTLATCVEDDRLAVFLRKIRPGETKDALQEQVDQAFKR